MAPDLTPIWRNARRAHLVQGHASISMQRSALGTLAAAVDAHCVAAAVKTDGRALVHDRIRQRSWPRGRGRRRRRRRRGREPDRLAAASAVGRRSAGAAAAHAAHTRGAADARVARACNSKDTRHPHRKLFMFMSGLDCMRQGLQECLELELSANF